MGLYFQGGIKTIVWTDAIQTVCMILAVILTISGIMDVMGEDIGNLISRIRESDYSQVFFFEGGWEDPNNFQAILCWSINSNSNDWLGPGYDAKKLDAKHSKMHN